MGIDINYCVVEGMEVGEARNRIAEEALRSKSKYIWFVDDDTAPPRHAAKKLMTVMQQEEDVAVCGGIYCTKSEVPEPIVQKTLRDGVFWNWKPGEVFDCEGLGTGCMMVRVEVLNQIERPWFKTVDTLDTGNGEYKQTDDLYFCSKLVKAGLKIKAHAGVLPLHWDAAHRVSYGVSDAPVNGIGKPEMRITQSAGAVAGGIYA